MNEINEDLNSLVTLRWDTVEEGGTRYLELDVEDTIKTFTHDEINKFNLWTQIFRLEKGFYIIGE